MLAIVWALKSIKNYVYGNSKVKIFTDHQPLTHSLSSWHRNAKIKRWKAILEEYDYQLVYKPGKENIVADALSRTPNQLNNQINSMTATIHSADSSSHHLIPSLEAPINVYKNQIIIAKENRETYEFSIPFPTIHRHYIAKEQFSETDLISLLKKYLNPSVMNGILTTEDIMAKLQNIYPSHFNTFKIRFSQNRIIDLEKDSDQEEEILKTHNRAHRNAYENQKQILLPKNENQNYKHSKAM